MHLNHIIFKLSFHNYDAKLLEKTIPITYFQLIFEFKEIHTQSYS